MFLLRNRLPYYSSKKSIAVHLFYQLRFLCHWMFHDSSLLRFRVLINHFNLLFWFCVQFDHLIHHFYSESWFNILIRSFDLTFWFSVSIKKAEAWYCLWGSIFLIPLSWVFFVLASRGDIYVYIFIYFLFLLFVGKF